MVAFAESFAPEKPAAEPKTRVWDFFGPDVGRVGESASQAVDRVGETGLLGYDSRRAPSLEEGVTRAAPPLQHQSVTKPRIRMSN